MPELPTGAVTFLFTDIEGSTRLLKQLRERYAGVLAEHQRILRDAFAVHGGYEVDTQGDSFFVAFSSARDAVLAAVEGQVALLSHSWPDGVEVKVRMGLHTGQAAAANGRYTGLAVHRAARIGAAGHGSQVLVSQATQTLLEDEEEDLHVFLRDLGEQRLKDLDRPVRLYQANADGLPASFPPLRHEAELAQAANEALAPPAPLYRRPLLLAAAVGLAAVAAIAVLLVARSGGGGLGSVQENAVGVIDPESGRIVDEVPVGRRPGAVALGAGAVWVANEDDLSLSRIDPATHQVARTISVPAGTPTGIAVGEGAVWVVHGRIGLVSRVDPQFNSADDEPLDPGVGRSSEGAIAAGGSGVWVTFAGHTITYVARIRPASGRFGPEGFPDGRPTAVAVDEDTVWVANGEDRSTISRVDPTTASAVETITVGRRPSAIAIGAGAVWVANRDDGTVSRVNPEASSSATIPVGDEPSAIAVGDGAVWVANAGDGTVSKIDPSRNEVAQTIEVGGRPEGLAVGGGAVWVTVQAP